MKQSLILIFIFTIFFCLVMIMNPENNLNMVEYLPNEINNWEKTGGDLVYTPATLYQYINGGAELFISYDFKKMWVRKYARPENPEITINVDVFDMSSSANAFGVFSQGCENYEHDIGQGSQYSSGLLTFWKGHYYISVLAYPETEEKKDTILRIGRHIAGAIKEEGQLPAVISLLPNQGLVKESIRYFRHYIWLNSHYFISNENILHIDKDTEVVLAKYSHENVKYFLLILLYTGERSAKAAYKSFLKHYLPEAQDGIIKIEDGKWTGCHLKGKLVMVVLNADTKEMIKKLFAEIGKKVI